VTVSGNAKPMLISWFTSRQSNQDTTLQDLSKTTRNFSFFNAQLFQLWYRFADGSLLLFASWKQI